MQGALPAQPREVSSVPVFPVHSQEGQEEDNTGGQGIDGQLHGSSAPPLPEDGQGDEVPGQIGQDEKEDVPRPECQFSVHGISPCVLVAACTLILPEVKDGQATGSEGRSGVGQVGQILAFRGEFSSAVLVQFSGSSVPV